MQDYSLKNQSANSAALEELRNLQTRFEVASAQVSSLEASNSSLGSRLRDLELQLEKERTRNVQRLAAAEEELSRTRDEMNNQIKEYHDLLDIKVALDSEINAYRKLLEFEENRLHITPSVVNTPPNRRGTPLRRTTPLKSLKRRRVLDESERSECYKVCLIGFASLHVIVYFLIRFRVKPAAILKSVTSTLKANTSNFLIRVKRRLPLEVGL